MPSKNWIEAGLLLRGQLRRELTKAGIVFSETKAMGTSVFIIPNDREFEGVRRALRSQGFLG